MKHAFMTVSIPIISVTLSESGTQVNNERYFLVNYIQLAQCKTIVTPIFEILLFKNIPTHIIQSKYNIYYTLYILKISHVYDIS